MSDRIPPLAALRAFSAVARLGSFARAADLLHVSTSAVSHQIRSLEADLGTPLLTRAKNGAGLNRSVVTESGLRLLESVEAALAQLGAACELVRTQGRRPKLAISANGSIASLWLAPRLAAFAALHPSVQWEQRAIEYEPDMVRDALDLSVLLARPGRLSEGDRTLFRETVFPVCSPALGLDDRPENLLRFNLLEEEYGESLEKGWSTWLDLLGLGKRARVTVVRFSSFNSAISAAIAGAGVALGRSPLIDLELASGRLVRPFAGRALAGSWDVILRQRPGMARDGHVAQLASFLLGQAAG
jgi:LysR family transcriptional regulator, glycine cleavage system transcriptional activator